MQSNFIVVNNKKYKFSDLVDIIEFEKILKSFFNVTGIANALVGVDGEVICQSGWINACALFHRLNPETNLRCLESNNILMQDISNGKVSSALCKNGLMDYATPIVIEN